MTTRFTAPAAVTLILALAATAGAAGRALTQVVPAAGIDTVSVTNRVGDVVVTAAEVPEITVDVTLVPRRGGLFSSYRAAEQEVESARLVTTANGDRLKLEIECSSHDPHFEAQWVVVLPARVRLELTNGVGDVTVQGAAGGVGLELGVGNATVEVDDGPVELELGVGDATVRGSVGSFGDVTAAAGVGNVTIVVGDQQVIGQGMVGRKASWRGDGPHASQLEVGVGDARIVLE